MINLLEEGPVNIAGVMFMAYPEKADKVADELTSIPRCRDTCKRRKWQFSVYC